MHERDFLARAIEAEEEWGARTAKRGTLRAFLYLVFAVIEPSTNKPAPRPLLSR
jgi:hypothetical protein